VRGVAGRCVQLSGRNGAGKTTLLRTIAGLLEPEQGEIHWRGKLTRADRSSFHGELAYLGHDTPLKADLTASENLRFGVGVRRAVSAAEISVALDRAAAAPLAEQLVRTMSAGALAGVLLMQVPLWLLDEPTTNLDTDGQALVTKLLEEHLSNGGVAVAAVHHSLGLSAQHLTPLELVDA
jgi:heme exporter protein A